MPPQSGQVFKPRLYRDAQQARKRNSRGIRMFLEESELWILSRISHQEWKTGLRQVYTVYLYNLELGDFEYPALSILRWLNRIVESRYRSTFEQLEHHHYQSNRKSNVSAVLEKCESFKWGTFHQDPSYHSNEMTPCPILHKTE